MSISNTDKAVLLSLTYAAQFSYPMKEGVNRVFDTLILPKLPFLSPATYLVQILRLLRLNESFEEIVPTTSGHKDGEIRDFLEVLADEIERRYPHYRRSGAPASNFGDWVQYDTYNDILIHQKGQPLPDVNGNAVVWMYLEPACKLLPEELVKNELQNFYTRDIVAGAPRYKDPEKYAEASAKRLLSYAQKEDRLVIAKIFVELSRNSGHILLKATEASTGMQWASDSQNFDWLSRVFQGIVKRIKAGNEDYADPLVMH